MGEGDGVRAGTGSEMKGLQVLVPFARCSCESVFYWDRLEGLRGPNAAENWCRCLAPIPISPHVPLFREVFRGFPALLVMCAAGDGGLAMLILLSGSGKYPSSLRRRQTTKRRVWLQPAGLSAPTRRRPRATVRRFLLPIHPCTALISNQSPSFNPREMQIDLSRIQGFQGKLEYLLLSRRRVSITQDLLEPLMILSRTSRTSWCRFFKCTCVRHEC